MNICSTIIDFFIVNIFHVFQTSDNTLRRLHPTKKTLVFFNITIARIADMYNLIHNLAILQTSHFHFKVYNSCKVPEDLAKEVLIILNEINKFDRTQVFQIHCCISGDVADIWFNFVFIQRIVHTSCLHVYTWTTS